MISEEFPATGRANDIVWTFFGCLILALFSWATLSPTIGWDDANITLNYAENIANGAGYVYYVGGERVEGSTSALWTAICTLGFLISDRPEYLLSAISLIFTFATVVYTTQITKALFRLADIHFQYTALVVVALFALIPSFFATTVWSLMETSLFCFSITGFIRTVVLMIEGRASGQVPAPRMITTLAVFAALMVLARPEGILLVMGACLVMIGLSMLWLRLELTRIALKTGGIAIVVAALLTSARLAYFGVPFPNTYYAKVATDRLSEIRMGLDYLITYLKEPQNALLVLLALMAFGPVWRARGRRSIFEASLFLAAMFGGVVLTYVLLGGDIFPGHRYYLSLLPALIPAAALTIATAFEIGGRLQKALVALVVIIAPTVSLMGFAIDNRNPGYNELGFHHRLAEKARELGAEFNTLPDKPSIAVFIAGGVAMTYDGPIYDMNGLNWVEMAHSNRKLRDPYGVFTKSVFMAARPDIVSPHGNGCENTGWTETIFAKKMLHGLYQDPEFLELYELDCWHDYSFFRLKSRPPLPAG